ncbi:MAG: hypothetical protein FWF57_05955 [Defluviitaleaceae bacterium]|nr:hypothetical protein [Defluviitaleaceae bacterium]
MSKKLEKSIEIYKKLGWDKMTPGNILTLNKGIKEEKQTALDGFKSGDWWGFFANSYDNEKRKTIKNRYLIEFGDGIKPKLVIFAIAVGVIPERAARLVLDYEHDFFSYNYDNSYKNYKRGLHSENPEQYKKYYEMLLSILKTKSNTYITKFIDQLYKSEQNRFRTHDLTYKSVLTITLIHELNLKIPDNINYAKDWSVHIFKAMNLKESKEYMWFDNWSGYKILFYLPLEFLQDRFVEHLEIAVEVGTPASGPITEILLEAVKRDFITRQQAINFLFILMDITLAKNDRIEASKALDILNITDEEIVDRAGNIIPILSYGDSKLIERYVPLLIKNSKDVDLIEVLSIVMSTTVVKTKSLIIKTILEIEKPKEEYVEMIEPILQEFLENKNKQIQNLTKKLFVKWNVDIQEKEETNPIKIQNLYRPTPKINEQVEKLEIGEITRENLIKVISEMYSKNFVTDITEEHFLALITRLSYIDIEKAKEALMSLGENNWNYRSFLYLSKGKEIEYWSGAVPDNNYEYDYTDRKRKLIYRPKDFKSAINFTIIKNFGSIPCLLSTPCFVDFTTTLEGISNALEEYDKLNLPVIEADLQLALIRLRISQDTSKEYIKQNKDAIDIIKKLNPKIILQSDEILDIKASDIILEYIKDPVEAPKLVLILPDTKKRSEFLYTSGYRHYNFYKINTPKSLEKLPNRLETIGFYDCLYKYFPYSSDAYYFENESMGYYLLQLARRNEILPPYATTMYVYHLCNAFGGRNQDFYLYSLKEAFERGIFSYTNIDIKFLTNVDIKIDKVKDIALTMIEITKLGMLSLAFEYAKQVLEVISEYPRIPTGTDELVIFINDYLLEVQNAVNEGIAENSVINLVGIRNIANKKGNSVAIQISKKILEKLPKVEFIDEQTDTSEILKQEVKKLWNYPKEVSIKSDTNITLEPIKISEKEFLIKITSAKILNTEFYTIADNYNWDSYAYRYNSDYNVLPAIKFVEYSENYYLTNDIEELYKNVSNTRNSIINAKDRLYLSWDEGTDCVLTYKYPYRFANPEEQKRIENIKEYDKRNRLLKEKRIQNHYVLEFLTISIFKNMNKYDYYIKEIFAEYKRQNAINPDIILQAVKPILKLDFVKPNNVLKLIMKFFEISYYAPILCEIIKNAAEKLEETGKLPTYINYTLDVALVNAKYLKIATKEGYFKEEYSKWQGLDIIANMKKKSVAREKAMELKKLFSQEYISNI